MSYLFPKRPNSHRFTQRQLMDGVGSGMERSYAANPHSGCIWYMPHDEQSFVCSGISKVQNCWRQKRRERLQQLRAFFVLGTFSYVPRDRYVPSDLCHVVKNFR